MTSAAIFTAVCGNHDELRTQPRLGKVWYLCWTDQPVTVIPDTPPWEIARWPGAGTDLSDRRKAKLPKCRPDLWLLDQDVDLSIWVDASVQIKDLLGLLAAAEVATANTGIAMFRHPDRDNIEDEAALSVTLPKYDAACIDAQMATYRSDLPKGLWASGVIARRDTPKVRQFGAEWDREIRTWSDQDQLSLPVALARCELEPGTLPGNLWANDLIEVHPHRRGT